MRLGGGVDVERHLEPAFVPHLLEGEVAPDGGDLLGQRQLGRAPDESE